MSYSGSPTTEGEPMTTAHNIVFITSRSRPIVTESHSDSEVKVRVMSVQQQVRKMSGDASVTRKQNVYEVKYKKIQLKDLQFDQGDDVSAGSGPP